MTTKQSLDDVLRAYVTFRDRGKIRAARRKAEEERLKHEREEKAKQDKLRSG